MIHIVTGDPRPIFKQIVDGFRMQIATGELLVGTKLPSVRGLAMQLTVNTNTVAKAYQELTALGLVESQAGRGLFVAPKRQLYSEAERQRRLGEAVDAFVTEVLDLDYSDSEIIDRISEKLAEISSMRAKRASA